MRIYKKQIYIVRNHPGISGFTRWNEWEYRLMTGAKFSNNRSFYELTDKAPGKQYFHEDGHLPDYQPEITEGQAYAILIDHPYDTIRIV